MNELTFLMSPYLLELPMQCLGNKSGIVSEESKSATVLLLDVLSSEVYLIDRKLLLSIDS